MEVWEVFDFKNFPKNFPKCPEKVPRSMNVTVDIGVTVDIEFSHTMNQRIKVHEKIEFS